MYAVQPTDSDMSTRAEMICNRTGKHNKKLSKTNTNGSAGTSYLTASETTVDNVEVEGPIKGQVLMLGYTVKENHDFLSRPVRYWLESN